LRTPELWIQPGKEPVNVDSGPRIGITRGTDVCWRFGIAGHPSLSKRFP
jgi:DNA-3-methyladenine glycosylase